MKEKQLIENVSMPIFYNIANQFHSNMFSRHSRLLFIAVVSVCFSLNCHGQSLDDFFVNKMKSRLSINYDTRKSVIEAWKRGEQSVVLKTVGNENKVTMLKYVEDNMLTVQTSKQGFFSLKKWKNADRTCWGMSWWVCGPACDGMMELITEKEKDDYTAYYRISIPEPRLSDFCVADTVRAMGLSLDDFDSKFEIKFIHYEFTETDTVWVVNDTPTFLDEERRSHYAKCWRGNALSMLYKDGKIETMKNPVVKKIESYMVEESQEKAKSETKKTEENEKK